MAHRTFERMSISIPKETKEKLEEIAKKEVRPKSNMIAYLIEQYYEKNKQKHP